MDRAEVRSEQVISPRRELTEAILFRKNVRPFRISGGVYYSYLVI
jgi:hypothetical protein